MPKLLAALRALEALEDAEWYENENFQLENIRLSVIVAEENVLPIVFTETITEIKLVQL